MADPHVISALVKKRAELAGEIEATHKRLGEMIEALQKLDDTLLLFDPDYEVEGIKPKAFRPPQDWSKRGEMTRAILNVLRQASEPLTTREVALQVMKERAVDTNNAPLVKSMQKRIGVALRDKRDQGLVRSEQGPGQFNYWELVRNS